MASCFSNVNAETNAVLEHGGPDDRMDAVALHVSYSQSYGRERITIIELKIEL